MAILQFLAFLVSVAAIIEACDVSPFCESLNGYSSDWDGATFTFDNNGCKESATIKELKARCGGGSGGGGDGGEVGGGGGGNEVGGGGGGGSGSDCLKLDDLRKAAVAKTNEYRAKHGASPLSEDATLNNAAQKWADHMASTGNFGHSQGTGYGENIYYSGGRQPSGSQPIVSWYDEVKDWNCATSTSNGGVTGHFTQVVWKGSKKVGHGFAAANNCRDIYVVANYDPPGNYGGQYKTNVQC